MLNECGLALGSNEDHLPPQPDNPEGFFEHRAFVDLNDRLLIRLGGIWREPPQPEPGWENDPGLNELLVEAKALPVLHHLVSPWGWKDPRNSLTLPFWRRVFPDLMIVICVRHPLEVAYSLLARDHFPIRVGLELWRHYFDQVLMVAPRENRVVVHYAALFERPEAELRRLLDGIGLYADDTSVQKAVAAICATRRHSNMGPAALHTLGADFSIITLYEQLCKEAGFDDRASDESHQLVETLTDAIERLERSLERCVRTSWELIDRDRLVRAREIRVAQLEEAIVIERAFHEERERRTHEIEKHLEILGRRVADLEERLSARRHRYADAVANAAQRVLHPFRR
jgi:hypothetical protein